MYSDVEMSLLQLNIRRLLCKSSLFIFVCSLVICGTCKPKTDYLSKVRPILQDVDYTVNPCEDFYEYACGYSTKINLSKTLPGNLRFQRYDDTCTKLIKLLRKDINPEEPKTHQLMKIYYQSCINTTSIEDRKLQPLQEILNALGGWPILLGNAWNDESFTWEQTDVTLKSLGFKPEYIFYIYVQQDEFDNSKNILHINSGNTKYSHLRHFDHLLQNYIDHQVNIAVRLGANERYASSEFTKSLKFESAIWRIADFYNSEYTLPNRLSIAELQSEFPYVQWLDYLSNMTYPVILNETDLVRVFHPSYMYEIGYLLKVTPKRVIANYMIWRAIDSSINYLNKDVRRAEDGPRDVDCLQIMIEPDNAILPGISAMYVKNYYKNGSLDKVEKFISSFKELYKKVVEKSWLDDGTRVRALNKIELMRVGFGIPNEILDLNFMDDYYKNVHLEPNKFFENTLKFRKFHYESSATNLKKSANKTFWLYAASAVSTQSTFHYSYNAMTINLPYTQHPYYDENQPNFMNYGALGWVIAHEITHSFVFGEAPWDEYGHKIRWWTVQDQDQYDKRTGCFLKQYQQRSGYSDSFLAYMTLNENIADTEAAKLSFKAYTAWKNNNVEREPRHFLNHTDEQLFWITVAKFMCYKDNYKTINSSLFTNTHASEKLRVNLQMSNSADFAKSFSCPKGSLMNPVKKCSFW